MSIAVFYIDSEMSSYWISYSALQQADRSDLYLIEELGELSQYRNGWQRNQASVPSRDKISTQHPY
jgi:hypothetical protein